MGMHIDGQDFKVKLTSDPIGGEKENRAFLAKMDEADNTIVIDGTMPKSRQEESLIHELIHIASADLPESMVANLSTRLYGYLRENGLLVSNIVERMSDGMVSKADAKMLNKESEEMMQGMPMKKAQVAYSEISHRPWQEMRREQFSAEAWATSCLLPDQLPIREPTGQLNENAILLAANKLHSIVAIPHEKKRAAQTLKGLFNNVLHISVPESIERLCG